MPSKQQKAKKPAGFTIIEVVLVLAIAGLIFLMVFVALPALQRSQRDTQRRQDVARVATAIINYQANSGGELPGGSSTLWDDFSSNTPTSNIAKNFLDDYIKVGGDFKDPDGQSYIITIKKDTSWQNIDGKQYRNPYPSASSGVNHVIYLTRQGSCSGRDDYPVIKSNANSDYALVYMLEGSGLYCLDNK